MNLQTLHFSFWPTLFCGKVLPKSRVGFGMATIAVSLLGGSGVEIGYYPDRELLITTNMESN